jgi:hypothetical protein
VLATGVLSVDRLSGTSRPAIARWDGATWTPVVMPPIVPDGATSYGARVPVFAADGAVAYSIFRWWPTITGNPVSVLLEVRGTSATVSSPPLLAGYHASDVLLTPDGRPVLLYPFGWAERLPDLTWSSQFLPAPWQFQGGNAPHVDADGTLWIPLGQQFLPLPIPTKSALLQLRP